MVNSMISTDWSDARLSIPVGVRGVLIANKMNVANYPFNVLRTPGLERPPKFEGMSRRLSQESLLYYLTFWDRLVWPKIRIPMFGSIQSSDDLIKTTRSAGILNEVIYDLDQFALDEIQISDEVFRMKGAENEIFIDSHRHAYQNLTRLNPGQWTLSSELAEASVVVQPATCKGIAIELLNAVPIVTEVEDVDDFLKWREQRSVERRRFVETINSLAIEIQYSENPVATLNDRLESIRGVCDDLYRVTSEKGYSVSFSGVRMNFNPQNLDRKNFLENGAKWSTLPGLMGLQKLAIAAFAFGSVKSTISVTRDRGIDFSTPSLSPFAAIPKLQYKK